MIEELRPLLNAVDVLAECEHPRSAQRASAVGNRVCTLCGASQEPGGSWELPERVAALKREHERFR